MELTPDDVAADLDVVDNTARVDVEQTDPDTGAAISTARGVQVIRRQEELAERPTADGGSVPTRTCRWHLRARDMAFVPKERYRIVDAAPPSGDPDPETWVITRVTVASFGTRYVVESYFYTGD